MKKSTLILSAFICSAGLLACRISNAQAFQKGSFVMSVTEGSTNAIYTSNGPGPGEGGQIHIIGTRDPFELEYGLSRHIGIGLTSGTDFYFINPDQFYNFNTPSEQVKAITSELTLNGYYHFLVTRKIDLSAVLSLGASGVTIKGNESDISYNYNSSGNIIRVGLHGRFYICHHLGFVAMLSTFAQGATTAATHQASNFGNNYSTAISGTAMEFGLCWRFKR
jgi:hypothetical protein